MVISSDGMSPLKANTETLGHPNSDLDTSSLSSDGENEAPPQPVKCGGPNIKFTKRKAEHMELSEKQVCDCLMVVAFSSFTGVLGEDF